MRHACRTDTTHKEGARALDLLGFVYKDTSRSGDGLEDYIVAIPHRKVSAFWCVLEMKTPMNKTNDDVRPSQFTEKQREWHEKTAHLPRIVATGFLDALEKLRKMAGME